jgi:DNA-binding NarL/FixJ family response regulator
MLPRAAPRRIRVLVVDDHQLYAEAVTLMLDLEPQIEVVGVARDGVQAIDCAQRLRPDVVLMDIDMPTSSRTARRARSSPPCSTPPAMRRRRVDTAPSSAPRPSTPHEPS